ncbi:hypothetical protein BSLG_005654 [Batrachochytrium salamandrivorans]|nr:hypothetical protein BSLG_005654 [Batrachochytrium salamandrivorans]
MKLWTKLQEVKTEISDAKDEFRNEREDLLDTIRELSRELSLKLTIIDNFIPTEERIKIEKRALYDEEKDDWIMTTQRDLKQHIELPERTTLQNEAPKHGGREITALKGMLDYTLFQRVKTLNLLYSDTDSDSQLIPTQLDAGSQSQSIQQPLSVLNSGSEFPVRLETMNCDVDIPFDSNVNAVRDVLSTATQVYACNDMIKQDSVQETSMNLKEH